MTAYLWHQKSRVPRLSCGIVCVILCLACEERRRWSCLKVYGSPNPSSYCVSFSPLSCVQWPWSPLFDPLFDFYILAVRASPVRSVHSLHCRPIALAPWLAVFMLCWLLYTMTDCCVRFVWWLINLAVSYNDRLLGHFWLFSPACHSHLGLDGGSKSRRAARPDGRRSSRNACESGWLFRRMWCLAEATYATCVRHWSASFTRALLPSALQFGGCAHNRASLVTSHSHQCCGRPWTAVASDHRRRVRCRLEIRRASRRSPRLEWWFRLRQPRYRWTGSAWLPLRLEPRRCRLRRCSPRRRHCWPSSRCRRRPSLCMTTKSSWQWHVSSAACCLSS